MDAQEDIDEALTRRAMDTMAESYIYLCSTFQGFFNNTGWEISTGSQMENFRNKLGQNSGPKGFWDSSDVEKLGVTVVNHLQSADQYMRGIAALLRSHQLHSTYPIIRSILELAGRTGWLQDPNISCRERSARLLLDRLDNAKRQKSTAKALKHDAKTLTKLGEELNYLRKNLIPNRFNEDEVKPQKNGDLVICGQALPGPSESLKYFTLALGVDWDSAAQYGYLSNLTHPTFYTIMERIRMSADKETGTPILVPNLDRSFLDGLVRNNAMTFIGMWKIAAEFIGLDIGDVNTLVAQVDSALA